MKPFRPRDAERDRRELEEEQRLDDLEVRRLSLDTIEEGLIEALALVFRLAERLQELRSETLELNGILKADESAMQQKLNPHLFTKGRKQ